MIKINLKFLAFTFLFLGFIMSANAQINGWQDKVSWSYKVEKISDSEAYIISTATLKKGWHVFSINHDPNKADFTGYPTTFKFKKSANYKLIGKSVDAKKPETHEDDLGTSLYFEGTGAFKQKIQILTKDKFEIEFDYSFQICDENGCLFPPDQTAKVSISGYSPQSNELAEEKTSELKIQGDFAKDLAGKEYVLVNKKWMLVPEGNSSKFYKKYLELGGQ